MKWTITNDIKGWSSSKEGHIVYMVRLEVKVKVTQWCPTFVTPWTIQSMEFFRPECWSGFPSPGDLYNPGVEPRSPTLQVDSLPAEPPGKAKNTGVGSLSLLQQIFLTQELSQDSLHCRRILYQLSFVGLEGGPLLWASSKKQNDSFEQVLLPVRPNEKSTWWKISRITQQKMYNLPSG